MSNSAAPDLPRGGALKRSLPRIVASLLIAAGFVWALKKGGLPFAPPPGAAGELRWWCVPAVALLGMVAIAFRTWRWIYLLRPLAPGLDRWRVFAVGLVGFSAVFFAPLRLGEFVRPYLLSRDTKVTFVQAVGTVAAERVIDGLVLVSFAAACFWFSVPLSPLPSHVGALPIPVALVPRTLFLATIMFSSGFAMMALFYFVREPARRLARTILGVASPRLGELGAEVVERLAESFGFLPSWQRSAPFLRNTLIYWAVTGLQYYALLRGVGLPSSLPQAMVTVGIIGLGSLLPAGPGFFGAYQIATYTSLAMYNPEPAVLMQGALAVFVSYLMQVLLNALGGIVGMLMLARLPTQSPGATS